MKLKSKMPLLLLLVSGGSIVSASAQVTEPTANLPDLFALPMKTAGEALVERMTAQIVLRDLAASNRSVQFVEREGVCFCLDPNTPPERVKQLLNSPPFRRGEGSELKRGTSPDGQAPPPTPAPEGRATPSP